MSDYLREVLGAEKTFLNPNQPQGLVADIGPDIPGGEGANEGFWREQIRDRLGQFAKMFGNVLFDIEIEGLGRITGHGEIVKMVRPQVALVRVKNHKVLPDGDYEIPGEDLEGIDGLIPDADYERVTGKKLPNRSAPELRDEITGDEAMQVIRNAGAQYAKSQGRFAMSRTYDDVRQGLRAQYMQFLDGIKKDNPELLKNKFIINEDGTGRTGDIETEDDFWGAITAMQVSTTSRWVSPDNINPLAKEVNRRYAEKFLGVKKDGLISFYRNVIQEKENPADGAAGYASLDKKMAWDYNPSPLPGDVVRGRYIVKAKPDEVLGILGYSGALDEFGVVISPEVTSLPGRFERVGDLEKQRIDGAPWVDYEELDKKSRFGGNSPFRFLAPMTNFDYYALDSSPFGEGDGWASFYEANGLQQGAMPNKYNELYGEGAWEKDFGSGSPRASQFANLFIKFTDKDGKEKWGLDAPKLRELSNIDMLNKADAGDNFDRNIKVLSSMQELMGKPFFVSKGHKQDDPRLEQTKIEPTTEPIQVDAIPAEPDEKEFKGSELLDSAIENNEINYDVLPESTLTANFDRKEIPKEQDEALSAYSGSEFLDINAYLRSNEVSILTTKDYLDKNISNLDALIDEKGDVLEETKVYRGTSSMVDSNTHRMLEALQEGDIIEDPAYSSTTKNSKIAFKNFGLYSKIYELDPRKVDAKTKNGGNSSFWAITLPVGSKALTKPDGQYPHSHEKEVLLPRGSKYKINGIRKIAQIDENGNETGSYNYFIDATVQLEDTPKPVQQEERKTGLFNEYESERADQITAEDSPLTDLGWEPWEEITIYRGVPDDVDSINPGDWVTTLPQLAKDYAGANGKVVSTKVKASELYADPSSGEGAYTEEMVWRPKATKETPKESRSIEWEPKEGLTTGKGDSQLLDTLVDGDFLDIDAIEDGDVPRNFEKYDLSDEQDSALKGYSSGQYRRYNNLLRYGPEDMDPEKVKDIQEKINSLDEIIDTYGDIDNETFVFRGMTELPKIEDTDVTMTEMLESLNPGDVFSDPGFTSTSSNKDIALRQFGPGIGLDSGATVKASESSMRNSSFWTVRLPSGSKALGIPKAGYGYASAEDEVILPRDAKLKIDAIRKVPQVDEDGEETGNFNYYVEATVQPGVETRETSSTAAIDMTGTRLSNEVKEELNSLISNFNIASTEAQGEAYREIAAELGRPVSLPWDKERTPEGRETYEYIYSAQRFKKATPENDEEKELLRIKNLFEEKVDNNKDLQEAKNTLYSNKIYKDVVDVLSSETNDFDEDNIDFGLMDVGRNLSRPRPRLRDDEIEEFLIESPDYSDEEMNELTYDVTVDIDESVEITNKDLKEFSETADVSIILPSRALEEVLNEGRMKTVHETKYSQAGNSSEEYRALRVAYESLAFGYDGDSPMEERPVYGLLRSATLPMPEDALMIYGGGNPAQIVLKPEAKNRTTISDRDSLNLFEPTTPLTDPKFEASHLTRMAAVYREATGENFFETENFAKFGSIEAQVHGGVKLEDIGKVVFYETPSEEMRELLTSKGIIWEVSRNKPYSKPRTFGGGIF